METFEQKVVPALKLIEGSSRILIVPSAPVDADALGSSLALQRILEKMGKSATINYSFDQFDYLKFLPGAQNVVVRDLWEVDFSQFELVFFLDGGSLRQFYDEALHRERLVLPKFPPTVNLDHHLTNEGFAQLTLWRTDVSSIAEMVYEIFGEKVEIEAETATNLLAGISGDTGHFRYANTSPRVLRRAAELVERGANLAQFALDLYLTNPLPVVLFEGHLLSRIKFDEKFRYAYIPVTLSEWQSYGLTFGELKQAVARVRDGELRSVAEAEFIFVLGEREAGHVWGTLRGRRPGAWDLRVLAQALGGGGHAAAASFTIFDRSFAEAEALVKEKIEENYAKMKIG